MISAILRPAIVLFVLLTVLTGIVYPLVVTGIAGIVFPNQARGTVIVKNGQPIGSQLIGQSFSNPKYFWSRPSATSPQPYNGVGSSGSNLGPLNPALTDAIRARILALQSADPGNKAPVPVDLVTASGSGLDPHISVNNAELQVARVAKARSLEPDRVRALIKQNTDSADFGVLGDPGVNVLELNLALDASASGLPAK